VLILDGYGAASGATGGRLLVTGAAIAVVLSLLAASLATTGRDLVAKRTLESVSRAKFQPWSHPIEPAQLLDIEVDGSTVTLLVASALPPSRKRNYRSRSRTPSATASMSKSSG
jgi:hypothetical protein